MTKTTTRPLPKSETLKALAEKPLTNIRRELRDDGVLLLIFDHPDSSANIFDEATMDELEGHIDAIANDKSINALIFTSAKDTIFLAGADLKALENARGGVLLELIEKGQRVFEKVAGLNIPTVAAIHGACLGGGLELALACDIRIASPDKVTKIGLPETMLGIIPAWGGSTRLPKLVGIPTALNLILTGKQMSSGLALKLGVIDGKAPKERLVDRASVLVKMDLPNRKSHALTNNRIAASVIRRSVKRDVLKKTRGNYPAQLAAIEVVTSAPGCSVHDSLRNERDAVVKLAETKAAKNLMRIFHLSEHAKKFRYASDLDLSGMKEIERTAVIGAGVMGSGIAQWLSARDYPVILSDINFDAIANGISNIDSIYSSAVKRRIFTEHEAQLKRDNVSPIAYRVPLTSTDLVIEAAVENLDVKKKIFADLCSRSRPDTILATNTSALPITELAKGEGITHPERIIGIHFFNPVHRMKLVEVVVTEFTDPAVVEATLRFVRKLGKAPVVVNDSPGFVVNRILMPYLIEAAKLFDEGVDAGKIDEAMLNFGMPMGPLRLLDEVGLDVALHVAGTMSEAFGDRFVVPAVVGRLVDSGHLGRKSGTGFFSYEASKESVNPFALENRSFKNKEMAGEEIANKLADLMSQEAKLVLGEGVADHSDDIDFAMILGTGYAPFRGGPLSHAKEVNSAK